MKKNIRRVSLNSILERELKDDEVRFFYDQKRFYLQIAHLVTDLRAKSGMSQAELAKKTGVSQPLIARLEKGDSRRVPTLDTIFKILKTLGYRMELSVKRETKNAA